MPNTPQYTQYLASLIQGIGLAEVSDVRELLLRYSQQHELIIGDLIDLTAARLGLVVMSLDSPTVNMDFQNYFNAGLSKSCSDWGYDNVPTKGNHNHDDIALRFSTLWQKGLMEFCHFMASHQKDKGFTWDRLLMIEGMALGDMICETPEPAEHLDRLRKMVAYSTKL